MTTTTSPRAHQSATSRAYRAALFASLAGATLLAGCASQGKQSSRASLAPPPAVEKYVDGVRAYREGDAQQAIAVLESATRANPRLSMARLMLGDLYRERGDYSKAADQYEAVTELDPYTGRNYYKLGVSYHLLQRLQDAIAAYLKAAKLDGDDWESHMNVGLVYLAVGRKPEAVNHLSQATVINPTAGVAFGNLGIALDAQARYADAEAAYKRALELDPEDTAAMGNLGKNLMRQGKTDQALLILRALSDLTESASARKLYGDGLVHAARHDEAIKLYQGILKEDGKYYPALNGMGTALIGKYEKGLQLDENTRVAAVDAWRRSLALNPQQPRVTEMLKKWQPQ